VLCLVAACAGLIVPALGGRNPVAVTIMAQISNVFVLPLTVAVILVLVNRRDLMGEHRAGPLLNIGLALAGLFACIIAVTGLRALLDAWF
jgi:Mn2+/Fe2+ NRAMP family transporter